MHSCSWWSNTCEWSSQCRAVDSARSRASCIRMHLRRMSEARGITLEELAERSGLSFRGVLYIEHGRRNPSLTTILNLARGLEMKPSGLIAVLDDRDAAEPGDVPAASP